MVQTQEGYDFRVEPNIRSYTTILLQRNQGANSATGRFIPRLKRRGLSRPIICKPDHSVRCTTRCKRGKRVVCRNQTSGSLFRLPSPHNGSPVRSAPQPPMSDHVEDGRFGYEIPSHLAQTPLADCLCALCAADRSRRRRRLALCCQPSHGGAPARCMRLEEGREVAVKSVRTGVVEAACSAQPPDR
jgi:hypothetical protein